MTKPISEAERKRRSKRQMLIETTLIGLEEIFENGLDAELTVTQEIELVRLLAASQTWLKKVNG